MYITKEIPVTVASSSSQSTITKSIVTTAPSSSFVPPPSTSPISQTSIPPLKQKTGIIKSKVPPPVPPRGSPRIDRRTSGSSHKSASASPRATPSGEHNYLNDKYFDTIQPNPNNLCRLSPQKLYTKTDCDAVSPSRTPIFRDRSPTCVRDWLEVNDFAASDYDESVIQLKITEPIKCVTIKPRKPLPFRTAHLQRQSSFRAFSYSSNSSVQCKIEKYVEHNEMVANQTVYNSKDDDTGISANIVSDRIKSYDCNQNAHNDRNNNDSFNNNNHTNNNYIHSESMDIEATIEKGTIFKLRKTFENASVQQQPPSIKPRTKKNQINENHANLQIPQIVFNEKSETVLKTLKRKQAPTINNKPIDENDNIKKCEILKSHSSILSVENINYLDAFSLDGEFV